MLIATHTNIESIDLAKEPQEEHAIPSRIALKSP